MVDARGRRSWLNVAFPERSGRQGDGNPLIAAQSAIQSAISSQPGQIRSIGNPADRRLFAGPAYQPANVPGLPPPVQTSGPINTPDGPQQTTLELGVDGSRGFTESNVFDWIQEDLERDWRSGRSRTEQVLNARNRQQGGAIAPQEAPIQREITLYPPFKADPTQQGGIEPFDIRSYYERPGAQAIRRLNEAVQGNRRPPRTGETAGIEAVSRGEAEFARLPDGGLARQRLGEDGRWDPTLSRDEGAQQLQLMRTESVNPGNPDAGKRDDAPQRRKGGRVLPWEIEQVLNEIEKQYAAQGRSGDLREDPRFLEMEEAARDVRPFPRREPYEGDPSTIQGATTGGGAWGGINPYSVVDLMSSDPKGFIGKTRVHPGEQSGAIVTLDEDASALWDREKDPTLGELVRDARDEARTSVITGLAIDELRKSGRFREPSESEMKVMGPRKAGAPNTLSGFMVRAGSNPYTAGQLLAEMSRESRPVLLSVGNSGARVPLNPQEATEVLQRVMAAALDPDNPEVVIGNDGRFRQGSRLPELYLERPDGNVSRLGMAVNTAGAPTLMFREWAPVYDPGVQTEVQVARRNSLGDPYVAPKNTPLLRIGRPTNQDNVGIKEALREIIPGTGTSGVLTPPRGIRAVAQDMQRGNLQVTIDTEEGPRALAPQELQAVLQEMVSRAVDPSVPEVGVVPGTGIVVPNERGAVPPITVRRADGSSERLVVRVRPGPNPEPLLQWVDRRAEVGPTFLSSDVGAYKEGLKRDPDQDLYALLPDLSAGAFSEGAPVTSTQQFMREQMAGMVRQGMTPVEAANLLLREVGNQSTSATVRGDARNAIQSAVIEFTGGESRLADEVPDGARRGLAAFLELARGINQERGGKRVVPPGDVRETIRPRVRLGGEVEEDVRLELRDPIRQALEEEMAAREIAGFTRGGGVAGELDDMDSDSFLADAMGAGADEGIPGESPRSAINTGASRSAIEDEVAAAAYGVLAQSPLAEKRSLEERGLIGEKLKQTARILADAALRDASATTRSEVARQVIGSRLNQDLQYAGPLYRYDRVENRLPGRSASEILAAVRRMAEPE